MRRADVYRLIDGERDYQDRKWLPDGRPDGVKDSEKAVATWLIYQEFLLRRAKDRIYHLDRVGAMVEIRKLAATCVACMEFNYTPPRG